MTDVLLQRDASSPAPDADYRAGSPVALALRMLEIRCFEESLDPLFERGLVSGTFHRCIGQEATAVGVVSLLDPAVDFVVSNHRNHGHYLAFTGDLAGLYDELKGRETGVCGGRGGSQVLWRENFFSNGVLGSTVPVAAGVALGRRKANRDGCVACFLGDGALCEGAVYEALNLAALWRLPLLFVVEWNHVAQSADSGTILAGSIPARFAAFGIETVSLSSTDVLAVRRAAAPLVEAVRQGRGPRALIVEADRLCAHSKGDDTRPASFMTRARERDPLKPWRDHPEFIRLAPGVRDRVHALAFAAP